MRERFQMCDQSPTPLDDNTYFFRVPLPNDSAGAYVTEIDKAINEHHPQLVLTLVPNQRADRYSAIKKKCIVEKPGKQARLFGRIHV